MSDDLLRDATVLRAASQVQPRSERQQDLEILEQTFVDTGVLAQLANDNDQILYGRRGTGKSHVFRVLGASSDRERGRASHLYLDLRLLGSAQLMTDPSQPITLRSVSVFRDLLGEIQNRLLDWATDPDYPAATDRAMEMVSRFADALTDTSRVGERRVTLEVANKKEDSSGIKASIGTRGVGLEGNTGDTSTDSATVTETWDEVYRETVTFAEVVALLDQALEALGVDRLLLLVDEWTAIPLDVQPYVAEFIRRTLMPSNRVTLKIASLEYRSNFNEGLDQNNIIGFEIGPDIVANLDLDDYYVYDRNPEAVVNSFLELLRRHLESALPEDYLRDKYDFGSSAASFRSRFFTEPATFVELVRAAEGVVRDFLGIFSLALFRASRTGKPKIDMNSVEEAARDWFETDKSTNLSKTQSQVLHRIITDVIGTRQARSFMLERQHADHPMIQSLFDLRLLHLMRRGYSDKENPGLRYNIYSLDYGTYVDLKRTQSQPAIEFETSDDVSPERIVPFDDKRSIRRIVLDPAVLDATDG